MARKCSKKGCFAPKGLCKETNGQYQSCPVWNSTASEKVEVKSISKKDTTSIPWSGVALYPDQISLFSHRTSPKMIGLIGAHNAGKTSYLGMLYTLLFNGRKFENWSFAGSYTLIAWESLAKYLKIKPNGKVDFAPSTPSTPDFYSLYHLALRNGGHLHDVLFADSSGEVFTKWAENVSSENVENARWIYKNSQAFLFFIDCEFIIEKKGFAKRKIVQLAGQVATNLNGRPITIVWSKADKLGDVRENIKSAIDGALERHFPKAKVIQISNYSEKDPDQLCHINNLEATEFLLNQLNESQPLNMNPEIGDTMDFFFKYRGSYGS